MLIVLGLESFWPLIYVLVCYPFAGVFGSLKILVQVGLFLLSIEQSLLRFSWFHVGCILETSPTGYDCFDDFLTDVTSRGRILHEASTGVGLDSIHKSILLDVPSGTLKSCFKWNDTLECFKGSSEVGANQCYLEYHAAIDQYKSRGLNVATYNDPSSNSIFLESVALVLLLGFLNSLIFAKFWYISKRIEKQVEDDAEADCSRSKKTDFRSQMKRQSTFIKYFGDIYPSTE